MHLRCDYIAYAAIKLRGSKLGISNRYASVHCELSLALPFKQTGSSSSPLSWMSKLSCIAGELIYDMFAVAECHLSPRGTHREAYFLWKCSSREIDQSSLASQEEQNGLRHLQKKYQECVSASSGDCWIRYLDQRSHQSATLILITRLSMSRLSKA